MAENSGLITPMLPDLILAVCSNGKVFKNPKTYRPMSKCLKHLQCQVSKKVNAAKNILKKALCTVGHTGTYREIGLLAELEKSC
ncbi:hypothetical protein D4Z78_25245 [Okeania hirsuta]|nr:hypothetical protein D4Z78_25245 [Okeania hirsuta]